MSEEVVEPSAEAGPVDQPVEALPDEQPVEQPVEAYSFHCHTNNVALLCQSLAAMLNR